MPPEAVLQSAQPLPTPMRSVWVDRLRTTPPGQALAVLFLCLLIVSAFAAPWLPLSDPNATAPATRFASLGTDGHLLGSDSLGRDQLARIIYGARTSLMIASGAVAIGLILGGTLGLVAGYRGDPYDAVIMRLVDVILSFPALVFAIAVTAFLGATGLNVVIAIAFYTVPSFARLARSSALKINSRDFVTAADIMGQRSATVLRRHYVPHVLPVLLAFSMVNIALAIFLESSLSFLGVGLRPPTPSWGIMISEGRANLATAPMLVLVPGTALFLTLFALNTVADGLRAKASAGATR